MKEWIAWLKTNVLMKRTGIAAMLVLLFGTLAWLIFCPKDLAAVVAYFAFLGGVFGGWTTINKVGEKIEAGK